MFDTGELNPEQRAAATHGDGPLLIVAGAGTGKTTTLAARVAWLVTERAVPPERILLLTYSRRAAKDLVDRAQRMTGRADAGRVWGGTFHAVANRLLRINGRALGLSPAFTVLDQADGADVMNLLREELGFAARGRRFPRKDTLAAIHSRVVNAGVKLDDVVQRWYPWCVDDVDGIRLIFRAYVERKRAQQTLDYDDLLLFWKALAASPVAGSQLAQLFDHVLVDEYQDTNAIQADILAAMRHGGTDRNLTVVGDDAQAIYGFRAATVRNILDFPDRFPGATVVKLERNYRSTTAILRLSNAVISLAAERHDKSLWTERTDGERPALCACVDDADEAEAVCRSVLEHRERGVPLKEQAVLFRAAHHSDRLEWFRVLQLPEGIGPTAARNVMNDLGLLGSDDPSMPLRHFLEEPVAVPKGAGDGIRELRSALDGCRDEASMAPAAQLERLRAYLEPVIARKYDSPGSRSADLEQLTHLARGYESRGRFLAELTLDPPASTADLAGAPLLDEDYLILSTIHSAKGLEWDVVHVIHASDGNIPSDMAAGDDEELEEERRLLYVALTRARNALTISYPQRYYRRQKPRDDVHMYGLVSRFLDPEEVRAHLDASGPVVDVRDDLLAPVTGSAGVDAYLADLFG
ncbi:MAG: ATP-dependent helicase [Actinobacteria bacterium]|nr:MAG: ATP-dependent helicase [Actinomycetota bacterium]